ncbi:MAG: DUF488 domain-containing protein [Ignavibacteriaceae bacterium]|nr:DUF488 domain-containing protein [Ignavibacteriaceae bacterium]
MLSLLQIFGGSLSKLNLQKYLFLFNQRTERNYYDFIPYKFGCYSFQANQDLSTLAKYKIIKEVDNNWKLIVSDNYINQLLSNDETNLLEFYSDFKNLNNNELIRYVYEKYPYYAINSKIAKDVVSKEKFKEIINNIPQQEEFALYTIGYEGKSIEYYTNQLIKENVKVLCDVRKNPFSMKYGFSKNQLKNILENIGIEYLHFPELGIESNKRKNLNTFNDFKELFAEYEDTILKSKIDEIEKLFDLYLGKKRIALTCFEADHNSCHRSHTAKILQSKYYERVIKIKHI